MSKLPLPSGETAPAPAEGGICFDSKLFAAVAMSMADKDIRYFIRCVRFEGPFAVATNGTVLTVARDDEADNVLPEGIAGYRPPSTMVTAAKNRESGRVTIDPEGVAEVAGIYRTYREKKETWTVSADGDSKKDCVAVEGGFPPWRQLIPTGNPIAAAPALGTEVQDILVRTAKATGSKGYIVVPREGKTPEGVPRVGVCLVRYIGEYGNRIMSVAMSRRYDDLVGTGFHGIGGKAPFDVA